MEDKELIEGITRVFEGVSAGIDREDEERDGDWVRGQVEKYHYLDIKNPETFQLLKFNITEGFDRLLVKMALEDTENLGREEKNLMHFLYTDYRFLERHLKSVFEPYEMSCSTDKSRWILGEYRKYLEGKTLDDVTERNYWHPLVTDIGLWVEYLKEITEMYYGRVDGYMEVREKLIDKYEKLVNG